MSAEEAEAFYMDIEKHIYGLQLSTHSAEEVGDSGANLEADYVDLLEHEDMLPFEEEEDGREDVRAGTRQRENVDTRHFPADEEEDEDVEASADEEEDVTGGKGPVLQSKVPRRTRVCQRSAKYAVSHGPSRRRSTPHFQPWKARTAVPH